MLGFTLHFSRWGAAATLFLSLAAFVFAVPNLIPLSTYESLPRWAQLPRMPLGLDLRGGTSLLYKIDTVQLKKDWLQTLQVEVRRALSEEKIALSGGAQITATQIRVTLRDPDKTQAALTRLKKLAQPLSAGSLAASRTSGIGYDLAVASPSEGVITLEPTEPGLLERVREGVTRSIEVLRRRIDPSGTTEATIQAQGQDRILIQVPGMDPAAVKHLIGQTAKLTFQLVDTTMEPEQAQAGGIPPDDVVLPGMKDNRIYLLRKEIIISGDDLQKAYQGFDSKNGEPAVHFEFKARGAAAFARVTAENVGKPFAIVLDSKVISAPNINEPIPGGSGIITGHFNVQEAQELSRLLSAGALPAALTVMQERSVEPSVGAYSIEAGKIAAEWAFALVSILMIAAYGLFGTFSIVALVVNLAIIMACLSIIPATLTLPGIAGMVLTMGVAVDANVLIFERIREEMKSGRNMISSIEAGFDRAYGTIIDSHLTGLLAAIILYIFGSGPIAGFAVTFAFGIVSSLFTSITLTRLMVSTWLRQARPAHLEI